MMISGSLCKCSRWTTGTKSIQPTDPHCLTSFIPFVLIHPIAQSNSQKMKAPSNAYTLVEATRYAPINLVPVPGVRCLHCSQIVNQNHLSQHYKLHLRRDYRATPPTSAPRKVNLSDFVKEQSESSMEVRSILPDEIPQKEQVRKRAHRLLQPQSVLVKDSFANLPSRPQQQIDMNIQSNDPTEDWVGIEPEEQIELTKTIHIPTQKFKVVRKSLKLFMCENNSQPIFVNKHQAPKTHHWQQIEYQLEEGYGISTERKKQNFDPITVSVQPRPTKRSDKVGTISTKSTFFKAHGRTQSGYNKPKEEEKTEFGDSCTDNQALECRGCRGFYCQQCGSDIPPQYRPANTNRSVLSPSSISAFYDTRLHKRAPSDRFKGCAKCSN